MYCACLSAGAMTRANMIGVSSGTTSSRGVRTVSWKRRRDRVARAVIGFSFLSRMGSGGRGESVAGQPQVDVVEGGLARRDRGRDEGEALDGGDRLGAASRVQRHGEGGAE